MNPSDHAVASRVPSGNQEHAIAVIGPAESAAVAALLAWASVPVGAGLISVVRRDVV